MSIDEFFIRFKGQGAEFQERGTSVERRCLVEKDILEKMTHRPHKSQGHLGGPVLKDGAHDSFQGQFIIQGFRNPADVLELVEKYGDPVEGFIKRKKSVQGIFQERWPVL